MKKWLKTDLGLRIIKSLFVHIFVVFSIFIANSCSPQRDIQITEKPELVEYEIKITDTLKHEDIKIMAPDCHSMEVPAGTLIGDIVTKQYGQWISIRTIQRIAAFMMLIEGGIQ